MKSGLEAVTAIAMTLCKSGKFETGQGTCAPLCMQQLGEARKQCPFVVDVHGALAAKVLQALESK